MLLRVLIQGLQDGAPQVRLPALVGCQLLVFSAGQGDGVLAFCPSLEPVGPVVLVLVKQIGQLGCQLKHALRLIGGQKPGHGGKYRIAQQGGKQLHEPPGHGHFVQG